MAEVKTWLITGVSSGFGEALADLVLQRGDRVIGTMRKPDQAERFVAKAPGRAISCLVDLTDRERLRSAIDAVLTQVGGVDVLVNNAGYGLAGVAEELSDEEIRDQMETNFFGLVTVTQAVLPWMRQRGGGNILNISSIAGIRGTPGMSLYGASKFAVNGFSEGLAGEVARFGIRVTVIEPGPFRTRWASQSAIVRAKKTIDAYATVSEKVGQMLSSSDGNQQGCPIKAARIMIDLVGMDNPPRHLPLGDYAVDAYRSKLKAMAEELDVWESVARATAVDE